MRSCSVLKEEAKLLRGQDDVGVDEKYCLFAFICKQK